MYPIASHSFAADLAAYRQQQVAADVTSHRLARRCRLARKSRRLSAQPALPRPIERPSVASVLQRFAGAH
ncbi:hypothetical protein [Nocardioides sp. YIM 152588]|uniref:hypothetical protein n=1 Tax=Nocardioides sp. YIM 152588 TaxID=3158259 RepID=UPI0032E4210E